MVGEGKLDREGRKDLGRKYFLDPKQFRKVSPPSLEKTRLHSIDKREYGLLSEKLLHAPASTRKGRGSSNSIHLLLTWGILMVSSWPISTNLRFLRD